MTEEQKQACWTATSTASISLGGNVYFLAKIFATDGQSFHAAALMTGMTRRNTGR